MLEETKKFACEIVQDVDGGYSAKRAGLFLLIATFIAVVIGSVFWGLKVDPNVLTALVSVITWMGGFIATERMDLAKIRGMFVKEKPDAPH